MTPLGIINYPVGNCNWEVRGDLELIYASEEVQEQCAGLKLAKKLFGGDAQTARKLLSRINALEQAETLKDIVIQPQFHFHNLRNKKGKDLEDFFAIDIKSRANPWRLILRPLDEDKEPFEPCKIDEIVSTVEIVEIMEVSKHYE